MSIIRKVYVTDEVNDTTMTVNSEGRGDIVQHAHIDSGATHFHLAGLGIATTRYILIDISDTTNYPHSNTTYAHVEWVQLEVDGSAAAAYTVNFGFLENVDTDNGDRYVVKHWSGTRTAGQSIRQLDNLYPNGWRMRSGSLATHAISLNDANYQTDVNLPTTLSPGAAATAPGDGDVILEVIVTAGTIDIAVELGYHSH
jgi:hypothetical protein